MVDRAEITSESGFIRKCEDQGAGVKLIFQGRGDYREGVYKRGTFQ